MVGGNNVNNWIRDAIFYHIYTLGFCGAPFSNDENGEVVNRLKKVEGWIEHFKIIGINAIYFGPLLSLVTHGYDTVDYYKVDRRLGSNENLKNLCVSLHQNGIRVILDAVFNHVGTWFFCF